MKNDVSSFFCVYLVTDAVIGAAWGRTFSGQYSRIKQINAKEILFLNIMGSKTVLNAKCASHHAAHIRQAMKKRKSITFKLGTAALQDVPGRVLFTAWRGRELEQR